MSAAKKIPEVLVDKIMLMAYALSPHPCAVMVADYKAQLMEKKARLTAKLAQLTEELAQLTEEGPF